MSSSTRCLVLLRLRARFLRHRAALRMCIAATSAIFVHSAAATPPPVITSVTVSSQSTGDNHSIAFPQTRIRELEVRGTDFFPSGSTGPLIILRRAGYPDRSFLGQGSTGSFGGDAADGWVKIKGIDLEFPNAYTPGMFDIVVQRPPSNPGITTKTNAFELKPQQSAERLVRRGGFGGPINKVVSVGNLLYLNSGPRFVILDAANPASPVELGSIDLLSPILDFQIRGPHAFVCSMASSEGGNSNGFCVLDIANPAVPQLLWRSTPLVGITASPTLRGSHLSPDRVWLSDQYAYVSSQGGGEFYLFDISTPAAPVYLRSVLKNPGGGLAIGLSAGRFVIVGSYLYAWAWDGDPNPAYLRVYSIATGMDPPPLVTQVQCSAGTSVGSASDSGPVCMTAGDGLLAFVTNGSDDGDVPFLSIWNISNPADPVLASKTPLYRTLTSLAIGSGRLFGAEEESYSKGSGAGGEFVEYPDTSRGLVIYDIADPANPSLIGTLKTHGAVYGVNVSGSRAYLRDHGEGLIIVDHTNPVSPVRLGGYYSPSAIRDVARNGDLLYVSDQYNGFSILNVANLSRPTVVGIYQINHPDASDLQGNRGIAYRAGKVYLAVGDGFDPTSGIDVVDVSNPAAPVLVQAYDAPGRMRFCGLEVDGTVLHAGAWVDPGCFENCAGLLNFTIDPIDGTISLLATLPFGSNSNVAFPRTVGGFTFCEAGIIDNRTPQLPVLAVADTNFYQGVALGGNYLYINGERITPGVSGTGLFVRDVSDPLVPGSRGTCLGDSGPISNILQSIASNGTGRLFSDAELPTIASDRGLYLYDTATNPLSPRLLASLTPFYERQSIVSSNTPSSLLRSFGSLIVAADRAGHYRTEGRSLSGQGLMIVEHVVPPTCPADFNGVGSVTVADIFAFLTAWFTGDPRADFNHVGGVTVADIFAFLTAWFAGC